MYVEVIHWAGARKTHILSRDDSLRTVCGLLLTRNGRAKPVTVDELPDAYPSCLHCANHLMRR